MSSLWSRNSKSVWVLSLSVWTVLLLIGVFAASVNGLMHFDALSFALTAVPKWTSFWNMDLQLDNPVWWFTKLGHFVGFGVEEILLYKVFSKRGIVIIGTMTFALLTELMQIPLGRDGRLYDVLIDSCGVLASWWYQSRNYYRWFWYDV